MTAQLSLVAIQDFFIDGIPATGGQVFVYQAGTTTKITLYTDSSGSVTQTNPVILNSRGEPQNSMGASVGLWISTVSGPYKLVFSPSTDTDPPTNPIWTVDNISLETNTAGLIVTGSTDPDLLVADYSTNQVSVGVAPITPASIKFYVQVVSTDPAPFTSETAAIQSRMDYQPSADNATNATGVYGTTWLNKAGNYSGGPAAVRGNIYVRDQGAGLVNVTGYMAGGIFRSRQEGLGTIAQAIAVLADAAEQGTNHGTITRTIGVRFEGCGVGTLNFGAYFNNSFADGSLASSAATDITVAPSEALGWTFKSAGYSIANSGDSGVVQLGSWGELVETSGATTGPTANIYSKHSDGSFRYRNTHASVGGAAMLHNNSGFQTTSFLYAPIGTAGAVATLTETLRINGGTVAANSTALLLVVNNGAQVLKTVEIGAADSGGAGYRMLRVTN